MCMLWVYVPFIFWRRASCPICTIRMACLCSVIVLWVLCSHLGTFAAVSGQSVCSLPGVVILIFGGLFSCALVFSDFRECVFHVSGHRDGIILTLMFQFLRLQKRQHQ